MRRKRSQASPRRPALFAGLLVFLGWGAAAASLAPAFLAKTAPDLANGIPAAALMTFAQFALATGLALLICRHVRLGFATLDQFFDAVLQRTQAPQAPPQPEEKPAASAPGLAAEGFLGERPYVLYADGSVDVETLLGPRRFDSMDSARAFVGAAEIRRSAARQSRPSIVSYRA
jgi:hypothetical protein